MGPIATIGRPGALAAALAANEFVRFSEVSEVVPTTRHERLSVWHRAFAIPREAPPPTLARRDLHCVALHGTRDVLVPPSVLPRLAADLPADTPRHLLPKAGHVPYFTHVADCARLLSPWLARISS
jgi:pimeloyl-ACP methyl ester carboxylesterase